MLCGIKGIDMKFKIDGCGGCGFCYLIWRQWFYHESGYSERACARDVKVSEEEKEEALKAVRQCPVGAISLVEEA